MQPTLFVKGFPPEATQQDLRGFFEKAGNVISVKIVKNFAFITYQSLAEAEKAVSKFHDRPFYQQKRAMLIEMVRPKNNTQSRRADYSRQLQIGSNQCFICKKQGHRKINCPILKSRIEGYRPRQWKKKSLYIEKSNKKSRSLSSDTSSDHRRKSKNDKSNRKHSSSSSISSNKIKRKSFSISSYPSSPAKLKKNHSKKDNNKHRKHSSSLEKSKKKNIKHTKKNKKQPKSKKNYSSTSRSKSRSSSFSKAHKKETKSKQMKRITKSTYSDSEQSSKKKKFTNNNYRDKYEGRLQNLKKEETRRERSPIKNITSRSNSSMSR